jgi:hypothetical protein
MVNKKGGILLLRIIGAGCGATGFIFLGVGGYLNTIIGMVLTGVGGSLIAAGS